MTRRVPLLPTGTKFFVWNLRYDRALRKVRKERVMPILIWIATLACMMEISGVLPSTREAREPSKDAI
jgi:hypothetical protein